MSGPGVWELPNQRAKKKAEQMGAWAIASAHRRSAQTGVLAWRSAASIELLPLRYLLDAAPSLASGPRSRSIRLTRALLARLVFWLRLFPWLVVRWCPSPCAPPY